MRKSQKAWVETQAALPPPGAQGNTMMEFSNHATLEPASTQNATGQSSGKRFPSLTETLFRVPQAQVCGNQPLTCPVWNVSIPAAAPGQSVPALLHYQTLAIPFPVLIQNTSMTENYLLLAVSCQFTGKVNLQRDPTSSQEISSKSTEQRLGWMTGCTRLSHFSSLELLDLNVVSLTALRHHSHTSSISLRRSSSKIHKIILLGRPNHTIHTRTQCVPPARKLQKYCSCTSITITVMQKSKILQGAALPAHLLARPASGLPSHHILPASPGPELCPSSVTTTTQAKWAWCLRLSSGDQVTPPLYFLLCIWQDSVTNTPYPRHGNFSTGRKF